MLHKNFVIVDFSASKKFTHHWKSIEAFGQLLRAQGCEVTLLVPIYSDQDLYKDFRNVKRILISTEYGPRKGTYWGIQVLIKLIKIATNSKIFRQLRLQRVFKQQALMVLTKFATRVIVRSKNLSGELSVVLPTLDPLALRLMERTLEVDSGIFWCVRAINLESRGTLGCGNETSRLLNIARKYPGQISIGYETFPYGRRLLQFGFEERTLFWSPFPPSPPVEMAPPRRFTVGFLGSAKKIKGFDSIPEILDSIGAQFDEYSCLVQESLFPWPSYRKTLEVLKRNTKVLLLPNELTEAELEGFIRKCTVIVLPYDKSSYRESASAILYHAAENEIPVICTRGTGFSEEVVKYGVGAEFESITEIGVLCSQLMANPGHLKNNFKDYNEERRISNLKFLRA